MYFAYANASPCIAVERFFSVSGFNFARESAVVRPIPNDTAATINNPRPILKLITPSLHSFRAEILRPHMYLFNARRAVTYLTLDCDFASGCSSPFLVEWSSFSRLPHETTWERMSRDFNPPGIGDSWFALLEEIFCRSEERRVGKEWRSGWLPWS